MRPTFTPPAGRGGQTHAKESKASMKAAFIEGHGGPEVLQIGELPDPEPRSGEVVLLGGADYDYNGFDTVDVYTPNTDTWSIGERLPVPRFAAGAATDGGRIFVVGGGADNSGCG